VPAQGGLAVANEPAAVLALLEGGEFAVHELPLANAPKQSATAAVAAAGKQQQPPQPKLFRGLLFQRQPAVTAARLRIVPVGRVPLHGLQGACMESLCTWAAGLKSAQAQAGTAADATAPGACAAGGGDHQWRWLVGGGRAARPDRREGQSPYGTLYCTGHRVRLLLDEIRFLALLSQSHCMTASLIPH
jgi:hypothetical protein